MPAVMLDAANHLLARAMAKTQQDFGRPICVAVCDAPGFLVAFARREGAPVRSIRIPRGKAYTPARMGVSTESFLARLRKDGIEIRGSVFKDGSGTLLGAIGISGLTSSEHQLISAHIAEHVRSEDVESAR
jgi:glc operon protein GlcG